METRSERGSDHVFSNEDGTHGALLERFRCNFSHVFKFKVAKKLTKRFAVFFPQVLSLLVACLCHDLDHRGTNNAFQSKVMSPLAVLYSTSTMEHHHLDECIMILSEESNNILQVI